MWSGDLRAAMYCRSWQRVGGLNFSKRQWYSAITGGGFAAIVDPKRFAALITAEALLNNVNVLASPHILALDNKEAKIEIGDEVPVATSVTQAGVDATLVGNTTSQVQFKSVGTI